MSENVRVVVRVRPFLPNEGTAGCVSVVQRQVFVGERRSFAFDEVFDMDAGSDRVTAAVGAEMANDFVRGFNVSVIAYGQTGAGKTFTMSSLTADVMAEVFCQLSEAAQSGTASQQFSMELTALEVYNDAVYDLLGAGTTCATDASSTPPPASTCAPSSSSLHVRETPKGEILIPGLTVRRVQTLTELLSCVESATGNRKTASTFVNATSSRSHCVVTMILHRDGAVSRCCFVDLAGSERLKKSHGVGMANHNGSMTLSPTPVPPLGFGGSSSFINNNNNGVDGSGGNKNKDGDLLSAPYATERMREGISINSGLLALGNVIVALCTKQPHIPYRSSKLTRILQPLLSGQSKTSMIACISPLATHLEETLNTLKYANRAKSIKTDPHIVPPTAFFSQAQAEQTILDLRRELQEAQVQLQANMANARGRSSAVSAHHAHRQGNGAMPKRSASANTERHASSAADAEHSADRQRCEDLMKEVRNLRARLATEQSVSKRLEDDLFTAEYTTMVEVEKRKSLEQELEELHHQQQQQQQQTPPPHMMQLSPEALRVSSSSSSGRSSASDLTQLSSPTLNTHRSVVKNLTNESDALNVQLRRKQEELDHTLALLEAKKRSMASPHASERAAEVALEAQRRKQLEEIRQRHVDATKKLSKLRTELAQAVQHHHQLQGRPSEDRRNKTKDGEAWRRLQSGHRGQLDRAQESVVEMQRLVALAEEDLRTHFREMEAISASLRAQHNDAPTPSRGAGGAHLHRRDAAAASGTTDQHTLTTAQEVAQLKRQAEDVRREMLRLQARHTLRQSQLNKAKEDLLKCEGAATVSPIVVPASPSATTSPSMAGSAAAGTSLERLRSRQARRITSFVLPTSDPRQEEINAELASLERLERELAEIETNRAELQRLTSFDPEKCSTARQGYATRLQRITTALADGCSTKSQRINLLREKNELEAKLGQLITYERAMEESVAQQAELNDRIDSLNEARKYHLHRVRRLQHPSDGTGELMEGAAPPSVRDINSARHSRRSSISTTTTATANGIGTAATATFRKVADLEAMVEHLRQENEALKQRLHAPEA